MESQPYVGFFEGVCAVYPMYRWAGNTLSWVIEHHARRSLGAYRVEGKLPTRNFKRLEDAVNYFNGKAVDDVRHCGEFEESKA